jgi:hypothetical protein
MRIKANYRHTSGLVAVALASSLAVPALAQDSASETEFLDNAAQPRGVADIIVTAERRETSVQKSSLAISVVDGDALFRAGVSQARDLAALVPGLQIAAGGVTLQTYVRGIGDFSSSSLGQSAVAYNVDGIYVADTASISTLFYDVARVELLKGPQGTLYGRNSSAGAMNLVLNPPVLGEATGQGTFEVGNYDAVRATLTVNLPLGETVAVRASGNYVTRGGYLSDGTDDDGQRGGRLQLLFEPHAKLSVKIGGDIERRRGSGPGVVLTPRQPGNGKFTGAVDVENNVALLAGAILPPFLVYTPGAGLPPAPGVTSGLLPDTSIDHLQRNVNAEINYDLDFAKVTFLPAYRTSRSSFGNYGSGSPFLNQERTKEQSYELRLSHNSDSLNLVAGLYYLDLRQHTAAQVYRVFIFGFSRGAYTARCVANVMNLCGIPRQDVGGGPLPAGGVALRKIAEEAVYSVYEHGSGHDRAEYELEREEKAKRFRAKHDSEGAGTRGEPQGNAAPTFIGVFDTVAALGTVIVRRILAALASMSVILGVASIWAGWEMPWSFLAWVPTGLLVVSFLWAIKKQFKCITDPPQGGRFRWHFAAWNLKNYDRFLDSSVGYARHALSIDENRKRFPRVGWGHSDDTGEQNRGDLAWLKQEWFAGNHSDIGGSYPESESRLSDIALRWMINELMAIPNPPKINEGFVRTFPDPLGLQHDEVKASLELWPRWWPRWLRFGWARMHRSVHPKAVLHESVFERLAASTVPQYDRRGLYRPDGLADHEKGGTFFVESSK